MKTLILAGFASALTLAACSPSPAPAPADPAPATAPAQVELPTAPPAPTVTPAAHDLVGRWTGPEGTSLVVTVVGTAYQVTVTNLDGPRDFPAMADPMGVRFTRDGQDLLIRKGTGAETGMKWLADKSDCVVVDAHEGYCRD